MAISSEYNSYQTINPYNFGALTSKTGGIAPKTQGYHQANAQVQGVPNTTPQVIGIPTTEQMELAQKITESGLVGVDNPFGVNQVAHVNEMGYIARPQNDSRELENSDISGSALGRNLDLQGCENKAWGKNIEYV